MKKNKNKIPLDPSISIDDDLKKLVGVFIITNKGLKVAYTKKILNEVKANYFVVFEGKDLMYEPSAIFETQMYDAQQEVYFIICQNSRVNQIMALVEEQCRLLIEPQAQVISIPLSSMINYNLFQFLSGN